LQVHAPHYDDEHFIRLFVDDFPRRLEHTVPDAFMQSLNILVAEKELRYMGPIGLIELFCGKVWGNHWHT
jgi:hypothetical protein